MRVGAARRLLLCALLPTVGAASDAPPALLAGESVPLVVRWVVEDGYYLDEDTRSSIAFTGPGDVSIDPPTVETEGRVVGIVEQRAKVTVAADAKPGRRAVRGDLVLFFCSMREKWCKRVTRRLELGLEVVAARAGPASPVELEVIVPLDEDR